MSGKQQLCEKDGQGAHQQGTVSDAVRCGDWARLRELSLRPGGFGEERRTAWPFLLHAKGEGSSTKREELEEGSRKLRRRRRSRHIVGEEKSVEKDSIRVSRSRSTEKHSDEHQIKLDTDRSFVLYPSEGQKDREELQAELNRLITSVFRRYKRLSYFQGYHDIITVLFLTLPESDQLLCAEKMSLHRLRDAMGKGLEPLMGLLQIFKYLMRLVDPDYAALLERNTPLPYFALSNLLTLFSHDVPTLALIQRFFDFLLCRPPIVVVYLAAALTLRRKEEAFELEKEGEEGMLHSLLASLPRLYDMEGGDEGLSNGQVHEDDLKLEVETSLIKLEDQDNASLIAANIGEKTYSPNISVVPELTVHLQHKLEVSDDKAKATDLDKEASGSMTNVSLPTGTTESNITPHEDSIRLDGTTLIADGDSLPESNASTIPPRPPSSLSSESSEHGHVPRMSLSELFKETDALYVRFPPTHPALHVSSIIGPQSVINTWSEDPDDLASDTEAEAMIMHPELVILPFIDPDELAGKESDGGEDSDTPGRAGGARQRRKLRKQRHPRHFGVRLDKKTVLTGTVVALGVAVAVYSMRSKPGGTAHGGIYELVRSERPWRKAAQWISGAMIGGNEELLASFGW